MFLIFKFVNRTKNNNDDKVRSKSSKLFAEIYMHTIFRREIWSRKEIHFFPYGHMSNHTFPPTKVFEQSFQMNLKRV